MPIDKYKGLLEEMALKAIRAFKKEGKSVWAILLVGLLSSCATQTKVVSPLPEALPDATGPAIIYSVGSAFEIDRDPYYDDVKSDALESFDGYLKIIDSAEVFNI